MIRKGFWSLDRQGIQNDVNEELLISLGLHENKHNKHYAGKVDNLFIQIYPNRISILGDISSYAIKDNNMSLLQYKAAIASLEERVGISLDELELNKELSIILNLELPNPPVGYINRISSCNGAITNRYDVYEKSFCFGRKNNMRNSDMLCFREVTKNQKQLLQVELNLKKDPMLTRCLGRKLKIKEFKNEMVWDFFYKTILQKLDMLEWNQLEGGQDLQSKLDIKNFILNNIQIPVKLLNALKKKVDAGYKKGNIKKTSYHKMNNILEEISGDEEIRIQEEHKTQLIAALRKEFDNLVFNTNELLEEGDINVNR